MAKARRGALRLSAALLVLLAYPAWPAKWDVVPTLSVSETYSDNISLAPDALKQSDWVTQVTPGISITATGPQLRFNANYAPQLIYYSKGTTDSQGYHKNTVFQQGNAFGSAALAKDFFFIDAGARVDQSNISDTGPLATSNIYTTGNRETIQTYFASPYLRRNFGSEVQAEARFTYSVVKTDNDPEINNSDADRFNFRLASGPAYKLLTWDLAYRSETIHYESGLDTEVEVAAANARRLITSTVGLLAQVGHDHYKSSNLPASEGPSWSAGLEWVPSPRTRLAATAGQRFYGNDYLLDFKHRTRLTTWSVGYRQDVTTSRSEFLIPATATTAGYLDTLFSQRFPDPVARQKAVENFIARTGLPPSLISPINVFTTQLFLQKTWNASAGIEGVRNVLIANAWSQNREGLVGDVILPEAPQASKQTGTSILWNWRMTAQDAWTLGAAFARNETPSTGLVNNYTYAGIGFTRQFQPRLSGTLGYRRQNLDSTDNVTNYAEQSVFASLRMRF